MQQVFLTELIDDFVQSVKNREPYIIKSRKYNMLMKFLGPSELEGLREAWAYFENPRPDVFPYAFDDTIQFLRNRYKNVKVYL